MLVPLALASVFRIGSEPFAPTFDKLLTFLVSYLKILFRSPTNLFFTSHLFFRIIALRVTIKLIVCCVFTVASGSVRPIGIVRRAVAAGTGRRTIEPGRALKSLHIVGPFGDLSAVGATHHPRRHRLTLWRRRNGNRRRWHRSRRRLLVRRKRFARLIVLAARFAVKCLVRGGEHFWRGAVRLCRYKVVLLLERSHVDRHVLDLWLIRRLRLLHR